MHLADYGAEVIKIEDLDAGDYLRHFPPRVANAAGEEVNPAFEAINRGKRALCLDLKSAAGREVFLRLVDSADAVLESFRPGVMERLGLGWEVLHARNPRLVLCSISGWGQDGPLAQAAGHDLNYAALAGVIDQNRATGRPAIPGLQTADVLGGALSATSALLIALLGAQRSGLGRHIDVAMADGLLMHQVFATAEVDAGTDPVPEAGLLTGGVACYGVYACADGLWLAVGALEAKFWSALCQALERPDWAQRHWSSGEWPGSPAAAQTRSELAALLASQPRAHWLERLAKVDACVTPVLTPAEALAHPQFSRGGRLHRAGGVTLAGPLAPMSDFRFEARPAPRSGEDTRAVLRQAGLAEAEIDSLAQAGVIA